MKSWKVILIGGFLGFVVIKAWVIDPLMNKPADVSPYREITVQQDDPGEVIVTDQNGREVSVNEILQWKPEVELEFE